jgi:hypothetical protein
LHPSLLQFFEEELHCEMELEEVQKPIQEILLPFKMPKPTVKPNVPIEKCHIVFRKNAVVCSKCNGDINIDIPKVNPDKSIKDKEPLLPEVHLNICGGKVVCELCQLQMDMEI